MAGYRAKYGGSLLRKVPEQVAKQELFEKEQSTKHEIAKKRRAEEKARLDEIQASRLPPLLFSGTDASVSSVNVSRLKRLVWQKRKLSVSDSARRREAGDRRSDNKRKRRVSRNRSGPRAELGRERIGNRRAAVRTPSANLDENRKRRPSVARTTR